MNQRTPYAKVPAPATQTPCPTSKCILRLLNYSPVSTEPPFPTWTLLPTAHSQVSNQWRWEVEFFHAAYPSPSAVLLPTHDPPFPFPDSLEILCRSPESAQRLQSSHGQLYHPGEGDSGDPLAVGNKPQASGQTDSIPSVQAVLLVWDMSLMCAAMCVAITQGL